MVEVLEVGKGIVGWVSDILESFAADLVARSAKSCAAMLACPGIRKFGQLTRQHQQRAETQQQTCQFGSFVNRTCLSNRSPLHTYCPCEKFFV